MQALGPECSPFDRLAQRADEITAAIAPGFPSVTCRMRFPMGLPPFLVEAGLGCVVVATPTSRERERAEAQHSHHCTINQHAIAWFPPSVFAYRQAGPPVSTGGFLDVEVRGSRYSNKPRAGASGNVALTPLHH